MTWIYHQKTGQMFHDDTYIATGWSGHGQGKNNPDMQKMVGVGPIPRGEYTIGHLFNNKHSTGSYSMRLTPSANNHMFGRTLFLIHGASTDPTEFGQESDGCIIMRRDIRLKIGTSADRSLKVVE